MEQFAQFPNSRANVMNQTLDIRDRLNKALRLVDEIACPPVGARPDSAVTERHVQNLLTFRRKRVHFFDAALFADPAWDILLELYAAELGQRRVSISSVGIGAALPATTALRWINVLETKGMIWRHPDPMDGRRVFVALTPDTVSAMDRFFASVPQDLRGLGF
ncbi:MAG: MarR family transcriptional regulator [Sphingomicrobium sp.]